MRQGQVVKIAQRHRTEETGWRSASAKGLRTRLPAHVAMTGGLAADRGRSEETLVFLDTLSDQRTVVATGFCGASLSRREA